MAWLEHSCFVQKLIAGPEEPEERARQILTTWTSHGLTDDRDEGSDESNDEDSDEGSDDRESRLLVLMTLYQTQCPSLVQEVDKYIIDGWGSLDLENSNITAVECRAIAFSLHHTQSQLMSLK